MRDWAFRGQTRRYGEKVRMGDGKPLPSIWAYGTGVCVGSGDFSIIYGDLENALDAETAFGRKHTVYTDTLGRWTGLTDKNGKRIFEGDVVKYHDSPTLYLVKWNDTYPGFWLWRQNDYKHLLNPAVEVVGNVADNPELLGGR